MTYTKKKIAIEVEVPDGATHYELNGESIYWYRLRKSAWSWWDEVSAGWRSYYDMDYTPGNAQPIEVIE